MKGKLTYGELEMPSNCDICKRHRSHGSHKKCSQIRQERHAQILRNEAFDNLLMFDKKGENHDSPISIQRADAQTDK